MTIGACSTATLRKNRIASGIRHALFFAPLMLTGVAAQAAPSISGLAGTFADGQTITIKGAGFGGGPRVIIFDDFEEGNGTTGSVIPLTSPRVGEWTKYGEEKGRPHYHSFSHSGSHGMALRDRTYIQYPTDDRNRQGQFWQVLGDVTEAFVSIQVAIPPGTPFPGTSALKTFSSMSSWKFSWLFDGATGYSGVTSNIYADTWGGAHSGGGAFNIAGNGLTWGTYTRVITQDDSSTLWGNNFWAWDQYNRVTVWMRGNPAGLTTLPGDVLWQVVNKQKGMNQVHRNNLRPIFNSGYTTKWNQLIIPGWWGNGDWSNFDGVYDDIYVAVGPNAAARVEIGDAPTYSACKNLTLLTPTNWSSGQITATVRAGSFKSFSGTYLFVTDANNNVSAGIPVSTLRPSAPSLTVQ